MRLPLNGEMVADDDGWIYDWFEIGHFSPQDIRTALDGLPASEELVLEVNSVGGDVMAGFECYSILRSASARHSVRAEVQSLAASAASVMIMGCGRVELSPVAQIMIHLPWVSTTGNAPQLRESASVLDSITESILNAYELRCRGHSNRAELRERMEASAWIPAQDAVNMGLADAILYQEDEAALKATGIYNCISGGIHALAYASSGASTIDALLARYQELVDAGAAPARGTARPKEPAALRADWRNAARLEIAKAKGATKHGN